MRTTAVSRFACMVGLAVASSGCGDPPPASAPDLGSWRLSEEPTLEIGVVEGDDRYQLHDVRDAARLADGRIAIAHQGTVEIRVYDAQGRFLSAAGGPGDGPGEWRQVAAVHLLSGDTLVVVDPLLDRVGLLHATTGAYLGGVGDARAPEILPRRRRHRGLVVEVPPGFNAWGALESTTRAVDIRSARAPAEIRVGDDGRVWVLPAPGAVDASLRVFDLGGDEGAILRLPDRFETLSVDGHEVMGVWRDTMDVEHLRVYAVEGGEPWSGARATEGLVGDAADPPEEESTEAPELVAHFRDIAIAQEMQYPGTGSYTTDLDALEAAWAFELPTGLRVDFLAAGPTGWWGRLVDTGTGAGCMLAYGAFVPVEGLVSGTPACWEGEP